MLGKTRTDNRKGSDSSAEPAWKKQCVSLPGDFLCIRGWTFVTRFDSASMLLRESMNLWTLPILLTWNHTSPGLRKVKDGYNNAGNGRNFTQTLNGKGRAVNLSLSCLNISQSGFLQSLNDRNLILILMRWATTGTRTTGRIGPRAPRGSPLETFSSNL